MRSAGVCALSSARPSLVHTNLIVKLNLSPGTLSPLPRKKAKRDSGVPLVQSLHGLDTARGGTKMFQVPLETLPVEKWFIKISIYLIE